MWPCGTTFSNALLRYEESPLRHLGRANAKTAQLDQFTRSIRTSKRVMFDAHWENMARTMNERLLPFLPPEVKCMGYSWKVYKQECINSRWRCNRYDKGGYFNPHYDAGYVYSPTRQTLLTFILYLNDGFKGGNTTFLKKGRGTEKHIEPVVPKTGMALIFFQAGMLSPLHEGASLTGTSPKYILRSDLSYERTAA